MDAGVPVIVKLFVAVVVFLDSEKKFVLEFSGLAFTVITPPDEERFVIETVNGNDGPGPAGSVELLAGFIVTFSAGSVEHESPPFDFLQAEPTTQKRTNPAIMICFISIYCLCVLKVSI